MKFRKPLFNLRTRLYIWCQSPISKMKPGLDHSQHWDLSFSSTIQFGSNLGCYRMRIASIFHLLGWIVHNHSNKMKYWIHSPSMTYGLFVVFGERKWLETQSGSLFSGQLSFYYWKFNVPSLPSSKCFILLEVLPYTQSIVL